METIYLLVKLREDCPLLNGCEDSEMSIQYIYYDKLRAVLSVVGIEVMEIELSSHLDGAIITEMEMVKS